MQQVVWKRNIENIIFLSKRMYRTFVQQLLYTTFRGPHSVDLTKPETAEAVDLTTSDGSSNTVNLVEDDDDREATTEKE